MFGQHIEIPNPIPIEEIGRLFDSKNAVGKPFMAMGLLHLNLKKFSKIHTKALKQEHLHYLYLRKEFEAVAAQVAGKISPEQCKTACKIFEKAVAIISETTEFENLIANHVNKYSEHSRGISELDTRSPFETSKEIDYDPTTAAFVPMKPKDSGVEPGYEGYQTEDVFRLIYNEYPDLDKRIKFIEDLEANFHLMRLTLRDRLPRYMIKLTNEVSDRKKIVPRDIDVGRTATVKGLQEKSSILGAIAIEIYKFTKTCTPLEKNIEAISEVIANDVARLFMQVQDQRIYPGESKQGLFQVLLKQEWVKGATTLKTVGWDSAKTNNTRARSAVVQGNGIKYVSDNSIKHLAEVLPILIVQSDRDAIGSNGQNKLLQNNKLVGIDFGHAHPADQVAFDPRTLHVLNPNFKNYSIFYDAPRSEMMRGLLRLARLAGWELEESVLKSYGEDFYSEVMQLQPGTDSRIFDDYIQKMEQLANDFDFSAGESQANKQCCMEIKKHIAIIKERYLAARHHLLLQTGLYGYFGLSRDAMNVIENVEKLIAAKCGETSLRNDNGDMLLNHIRVIKMPVQFEVKTNSFTHTVNIKFSNHTTLESVYFELKDWLTKSKLNLPVRSIMQTRGDTISLTLTKADLNEFNNVFSEDKIKEKFHAPDFKHYKIEGELENIRQALSSCRVMVDIRVIYRGQAYEISIMPLENAKLDQLFVEILTSKIALERHPDRIKLNIEPANLIVTSALLQYIPTLYSRQQAIEKKILATLESFNKTHNDLMSVTDNAKPLMSMERTSVGTVDFIVFKSVENAILKDLLTDLPTGEIDHTDLPTLMARISELPSKYKQMAEAANKEYANAITLSKNFNLHLMRDPNRPFHYLLDVQMGMGVTSELRALQVNTDGHYVLNYKNLGEVMEKIQKVSAKLDLDRERVRIENQQWQQQMIIKQLNIFQKIKDTFFSHTICSKLEMSVEHTSQFIIKINADQCDPSLQTQLAQHLADFNKLDHNTWSLDLTEMLLFNDKLLDAYHAHTNNYERVKVDIVQQRKDLISLVHKLIFLLNRSPSENANFFGSSLKYAINNYAKLFSSDLTAINFIETLKDYAIHTYKCAQPNDILALRNKLQARKDHITSLRSEVDYTNEIHLLNKSIGLCNSLMAFKPYELDYAGLNCGDDWKRRP